MRKEMIEQVVLTSGLWALERKLTHGFLLSSSVYEVDAARKKEFEEIGVALHDCLAGMGRIIHVAVNPELAYSKTWQMIARASRSGIPSYYRDIQIMKPSRVPAICKVDFMENTDGHLLIAEIDGHNKHGLGYSTLGARMRQVVAPEAAVFPGAATMLSQIIKKRNSDSNELVLLYADQERFYLPEFEVLQAELAKHQINVLLVGENDFDASFLQDGRLFLDFPFLYISPELNRKMLEAYQERRIDFLIPPKPFLGSKALLALLRNDENNDDLEVILRSQIPSASLDLIREYIPETYLVSKMQRPAYWQGLIGNREFLVKGVISSGMKSIAFPDDGNFDAFLQKAMSSYYLYILQQKVENRPRTLGYFADGGQIIEGSWFTRITVHYAQRRVADIILTARQDKKVHGAPDCLQLGTVLV